MIVFALLLFAAAVAGWFVVAGVAPVARGQARFAFLLYAGLGIVIAANVRLTDGAVLIVSAAAPMLLAFAIAGALRRRFSTALACVALASACIAGMAAAVTGIAALAFAPLLLSVVGTVALALPGWRDRIMAATRTAASAVALLAGAAAFVAGGAASQAAFCAFTAAGLLGAALSLTSDSGAIVEKARRRNSPGSGAVGGVR